MQKRILGRSGLEVSPLGLGCYAIGGEFRVENGKSWGWTQVDDAESIRALHAAVDLGVNFFDTAQAYGLGHSESVLGRALYDRRDRVVVATKFGKKMDTRNKQVLGSTIDPAEIRKSLHDSLRRLKTDYIDLFQWHESKGSAEDLAGLQDLLEDLVAEGKIRWYGWSTDDPERAQLMAAWDHCAAIQHQVHVFSQPQAVSAMLDVCERQDLGSINRSPLMMGILTGKFTRESTFDEQDVRHSIGMDFKTERFAQLLDRVDTIREILASEGRTPVQGALAWIWGRSERMIPIPGFRSVAQVTENARAMDFGPLAPEQMKEIDTILER